METSELHASAINIGWFSFFVSVSVVAMISGVIFIVVRFVVKPVARISRGLADASELIASASNQIASTSCLLAEIASKLTTTALFKFVPLCSRRISGLKETGFLRKIRFLNVSERGDVIDEIAFQTNLLALNAAVEAAPPVNF
ncbi:MAG: hypothetical protein GY749_50360 [Desulfobacteraceae bacterium]|nr:hypothetical protein [Desulfobacteraceae bacterium]